MKNLKYIAFIALILFLQASNVRGQKSTPWRNKECAVVLTYDDALDIDLDNVLPQLDSLNLKGTFYLIGSSPVISLRMLEWRKAASEGHELGNHTLFHPCDGQLPGRGFVTSENDLSKYTVARAVEEIKINNTLLKAIDGKDRRTFAYPCGDLKINGVPFFNEVKADFSGARGVSAGMEALDQVNLDDVKCYLMNGSSADQMIDLVKKAKKTNTLLVFLFHGVGGGHTLNVDKGAHSKLLHYLHDNEKDIWIAPMVEVADFIKSTRQKN